jgi:hypothetical protein
MKGQKKLTRREMLKLSGTVAAGSLLAACAPAVAPTVAPTPVPPTVAPTAVPPTVAPTKVPPTSAPAPAGPVTLKVFDPSGAFEVTQLNAPRLDTLAGKTICGLGYPWEFPTTFALISDLLKKQYPTATFIPSTDLTKFPNYPGGSDWRADAKVAEKIKKAGCDAVIVGNAG